MNSHVAINGSITVSNERPFVLFGGLNVLDGKDLAFEACNSFVNVTNKLDIPFVFKASFDKANRSSIRSYRGPGLDKGLDLLASIKKEFAVPIITDIHEPDQADVVAEIADIVQIPAFLARQTDLVTAAAKTGAVINIKKPQFLSPSEMRHIVRKCHENGNEQIMVCERGTAFGYNNLVVDMLGMDLMKSIAPVIFDVTHALQKPGGRADSADGRRDQVTALARAGMAVGIGGLFLETHPDPDKAKCDGPCALKLDQLEAFLTQIKAVDQAVKSFETELVS